MEEQGEINMECSLQKFCVSWLAIRVCCVGTKLAVEAWNDHPIPGIITSYYIDHLWIFIYIGPRRGCPSRGTPNYLMELNNQIAKIEPQLIPTPENALMQYEAAGGRITHFNSFGIDPLIDDLLIEEQNTQFQRRYPTVDTLFHQLVNSDDRPFRDAFCFFIQVTQMLQQ